MANWLGVKNELHLPSDAVLRLNCGFYEDFMNSAPPNTKESADASDRYQLCIDKVYETFTADALREQYMLDQIVLAGTIIVPIVLAIVLHKRIFRLFDKAIVGGAAAAIRNKRKANAYMSDLKSRIEQKTSE